MVVNGDKVKMRCNSWEKNVITKKKKKKNPLNLYNFFYNKKTSNGKPNLGRTQIATPR
jgi:hypothetical protein